MPSKRLSRRNLAAKRQRNQTNRDCEPEKKLTVLPQLFWDSSREATPDDPPRSVEENPDNCHSPNK